MLPSLALAVALSLTPAQAGQLRLTNERVTYGLLGSTRSDAKILPGDNYYLAFDIEGLQVNNYGKVLYSMSIEFLNKEGKSQFKKDADTERDLEATNLLGGSRVPAFAFTEIGTDTPPGDYTLRIAVTDRTTKKNVNLTRKIQVLPKSFGLVRVQFIHVAQVYVPAPPLGVVGETLALSCGVVGFDRDKMSKQPSLAYELRVYDENGKPTVTKPDAIQIDKDVNEAFSVVEVPFVVPLNRAGKFTIELKATDQLTKKTTAIKLPLTVLDLKQ
jgi:hypothetical protein